jgi:hypothetical protein
MKYFLLQMFLLSGLLSSAQFKNIIVEEVNNEGSVSGRTYRIYVEMTSLNDQLDIVFGDSTNPLEIKSTKPFYQSELGGALSTEINRKLSKENPMVKYDSWLTIGAEDNYDNFTTNFLLNLDEFEKNGGAIVTRDGAWFCVPTYKQVYCKEDKKILIMQITTEGKVTGKINISGKTAAGVNFEQRALTFTCG